MSAIVNRSRKEPGWCAGGNPGKFPSFKKDRKTKNEK